MMTALLEARLLAIAAQTVEVHQLCGDVVVPQKLQMTVAVIAVRTVPKGTS